MIQLALDLPGATVVLDDLKARRGARRTSIPTTGSLGVLLHAKRRGKLDSVAQAVERIRRHGGWLADDVVERTGPGRGVTLTHRAELGAELRDRSHIAKGLAERYV